MQLKQGLDDHRTGVRLDFMAEVVLTMEESDIFFQGKSINVSVSGLVMTGTMDLEYLQKKCKIKIIFPGHFSKLTIEDLEGIISRIDGNNIAVTFKEPLEWFLVFPVYQNKVHQDISA